MEAFFLFHRGLGSNDEDATVAERTEKLLFYTSACDDDLDEQLERVSMCEAFIDLCRSFRADAPVDSVFLDDHQYTLEECEPDLWLVTCCKSGVRELADWKSGESSYSMYQYPSMANSDQKRSPIQKMPFRSSMGGGSKKTINRERKYKSGGLRGATDASGRRPPPHGGPRLFEMDSPNARVCGAVMRHFYSMLVLFNGKINALLSDSSAGLGHDVPNQIKMYRKRLRKSRKLQELVDEGDLVPDAEEQAFLDSRRTDEDSLANLLAASPADMVRERLLPFVPFFLDHVDFMCLHVLYDMKALPFLSVDKANFLSAQLFMAQLLEKFRPVIESGMIIYNGEALWSSLPCEQTHIVFSYLNMYVTASEASSSSSAAAKGNNTSKPASSSFQATNVLHLKPGFLEIGQTIRPKELASAVDGADLYFPRVFNVAMNKTNRMAVYGHGKILLAILTKDIDNPAAASTGPATPPAAPSSDTNGNADGNDSGATCKASFADWTKASLLEFCGNFESFVRDQLGSLADAVAQGIASSKSSSVSSSNLFFLPNSSSNSPSSSSSSSASSSLARESGSTSLPGGGLLSTSGSSPGADATDKYLYFNENKSVVKVSDAWLRALRVDAGSGSGDDGRHESSYPSHILFGSNLPSNLVIAINDVRHQFDSCPAESMVIIIFVRPSRSEHHPGCWVAALKSRGRQIFLTIDAKHTFEYVSHRLRVLRQTTFKPILL